MIRALALLLLSPIAFAAPKIEVLDARPDPAKPEVEVTVTVSKAAGGDCDVRVDFGDGRGRTIDFGLATTRTLHYAYAKGGSYKVSAKGTGRRPCDGMKEAAVTIKGPAEKKKADKKSASKKKKEEPK